MFAAQYDGGVLRPSAKVLAAVAATWHSRQKCLSLVFTDKVVERFPQCDGALGVSMD